MQTFQLNYIKDIKNMVCQAKGGENCKPFPIFNRGLFHSITILKLDYYHMWLL